MAADDPDDPDDLYGLPLEEFVAARDALAKRLRAGGDRPAAEAVKGLAKPSAAAWAVNQAVRSQPRAARALWAAGDELVATQERLLAGKADRDALRAATAAQREALAPLLDAARGLLTGGGAPVSETALARVEESLHAAALDPDVRGDVEAGRLTKELRHVGMGTFAAAAPTGGGRAKRQAGGRAAKPSRGGGRATAKGRAGGVAGRGGGVAKGRDGAAGKRVGAAGKRVEAARRRLDSARDAFAGARDEARAVRKQANAAERAAQQARRRADRSSAAADVARERQEAARAALDEAEAALRGARGR